MSAAFIRWVRKTSQPERKKVFGLTRFAAAFLERVDDVNAPRDAESRLGLTAAAERSHVFSTNDWYAAEENDPRCDWGRQPGNMALEQDAPHLN